MTFRAQKVLETLTNGPLVCKGTGSPTVLAFRIKLYDYSVIC